MKIERTDRDVTVETEGRDWTSRRAPARPTNPTSLFENVPCGHRAVAADTAFLIGLAQEDDRCVFVRDVLRQIGFSFVLSRGSFNDVKRLELTSDNELFKQKVLTLLDETFTMVAPANAEETNRLASKLMQRGIVDNQDDAFALAEGTALNCGIFLTTNTFLLALDPELLARHSLSLEVSLPICVSLEEVHMYLRERLLLKG